MKKLLIIGALVTCLFSMARAADIATLIVSTDKDTYQVKTEPVYLHINTYDADGNYVSSVVKVTIKGKTSTQVTWMGTYPDRDSYIVLYFPKTGDYTITAEMENTLAAGTENTLTAGTTVTVVR